MTSYLSNLQLIWNFFLQVLKVIFDLYTKEPVFMSVFSLWVLDLRVWYLRPDQGLR